MSYLEAHRPLPPWPRLLLALCLAPIVPAALLLLGLTGNELARGDTRQAVEFLTVLAVLVGQSLILAVPLTLVRWRHMQHPLVECLIIGALTAPGLVGYLGLVIALAYAPGTSLVIWLILAALGAVGGACFWAVVTNFGAIRQQQ